MSQWSEVLNENQIEERFKLTSSIDASFAVKQKEFYESRSESELRSLAVGCWNANDADGYQLAKSYLFNRFPDRDF